MENNKEIADLAKKIDVLTQVLIGDKLTRKVGILDQIDINSERIKINSEEIGNIKNKIKTPWAKFGIASGAGVGIGGIGATKSGAIISKIVEFFS